MTAKPMTTGPMTARPQARPPAEAPSFEDMPVADAMHPGILTCPAGASLETVAEMMSAYGIHSVVVFDESSGGEALWGVVSDLDLVGIAAEGSLASRTAGQTAATPALTIASGETLRRAAQLMREYGTAHLVVVDPDDGTPLGVLSTLDLARELARP